MKFVFFTMEYHISCNLLLIFIFTKPIISMELIQIHTITRHGQRSPCFSYPSDPYKHMWTKGMCQLTDIGSDQLKDVGSYLRNLYKNLIPENFHKKDVYVRSSDTDRTIISALAAMKTIFEQQIVPVHTVPKRYDYLLKMCSICPYHSDLLSKEFRSERYKFLFELFGNLYKVLEQGTGLDNVDIYMAFRICDGISVWRQLNLTLPKWLSLSTISECENLIHWKFIISYSNRQLTRFRGGPLVNRVIDDMSKRAKEFVKDLPGIKMINFFTHDSTMSAFLGHLNCFNRLQPPLGSTIIMELYHAPVTDVHTEDVLSNFVVKLLFRNDTKKPALILNLSECIDNGTDGECRLNVLTKSLQSSFVKSIPEECGISNNIDNWFASSQFGRDSFFSHGVLKQKHEDNNSYLLIHILVPLLVTEIVVLCIFYKLFRR